MHSVIPWVPDLPINRVKIAGPLRMGGACELWLPIEQGAAVVGREQPLVWVDDEAVSTLDAIEEVTHARGSERRTAVRAINMHPDAEPLADGRDSGQVVDNAGVRGAGGCDNSEDVLRIDQCGPKGLAGQLTMIVFRHDNHFGIKHGRSSQDRRVCLGRASQSPLARRMPTTLVSGELPGGEQGGEVAGSAARYEASARRPGPVEQLDQPGECLVFREDRTSSGLPGTGEDVVTAHDGVKGQRSPCRRGWNVGEIHRVVLSPRRWGDHIFEDPQCLISAQAFRRDGLSGVGQQLRSRSCRRLRVGCSADTAAGQSYCRCGNFGFVSPNAGCRRSHCVRDSGT